MNIRNISQKLLLRVFLFVAIVPIFTFFVATQFSQGSIDYDRLLYDIAGKTFFADVYIRHPDGKMKLLSPSKNGIYYQAHINSQGDKVVFYGNDIGAPRIWIADTETGNAVALTPESSGARHAVFSWDGSLIAFASDRGHKQAPERIELMRGNGLPPKNLFLNLFIMDPDGGNVRQITHGAYQDQRPTFSPDGKMLAFVSDRGGEMRLWTVETNGKHEPRALQKTGWGYRPWYSADGRWIYLFSGINQRHQICKIPATGGDIHPLSNDDSGTSHGPFIDYDNHVLLMHSTRNEQNGIWELPLDGTKPRQIVLSEFGGAAAHATRSKNGILAFDVYRQTIMRKFFSSVKGLKNF